MVLLSSTLRGRVLSFQSPALPRKDTLLVASMEGSEAVSRPYRYTLDLVSTQPDLDSTALLANVASIGIKRGVALAGSTLRGIRTLRTFGILESFRMSERGREWTAYRAVLVPRLWQLSLGLRNRVFLDKTVPQIVEEVLRGASLTEEDFEFRLGAREYRRREYVLQYRESDLAFLSRLLEHEGIFYFFLQADDRERVLFGDGPAAYEPRVGDAAPYRPATASDLGAVDWFERETVRTFSGQHNRVPAAIVLRDYHHRFPSVELRVSSEVVSGGTGMVYEYGEHYLTPEEGRALAQVRAEEWTCREKIFNGSSDCRGFFGGAKFRLIDHFRPDFNAEYLVTEMCVRAKQAFSSGAPMSPVASYENDFACIPADRSFRPERRTPKPTVAGTLHAIVDSSQDGSYAELDDQGRYKVRLPLDLSGRADGTATHWIRLAEPYAGPGYGMHFPLHKGTEVLLTHENGDPDRPVISAAVPNPETQSPVTSANQTQSVIKTAGNNMILLDDQGGRENIFLHAQRGFDTRVRGTSRTAIEGESHWTVGTSAFERIVADRHITVEGDLYEETQNERHETVGGNRNCRVGGRDSLSVAGSLAQEIGRNHCMRVTGSSHVKAQTIVLEAESFVTLKVGGQSVVIGPAGVSVNGNSSAIGTLVNAFSAEAPTLPREPGTCDAPAPAAEGETEAPAETPEEIDWFDIFIDVPTHADQLDDRYQLRSLDGAYDRTMTRAEAVEHNERLLRLRFTDLLPGKRYALLHHLSDQIAIPTFQDLPFESLVNEEDPAPAPRQVIPPREEPPPPEAVEESPDDPPSPDEHDPAWYPPDPHYSKEGQA